MRKQSIENWSLTSVEVQDEEIENEGLLFVDNHGYLLNKEEATHYLQMLLTAYESENINDFIEQNNKALSFQHSLEIQVRTHFYKFSKMNSGMYKIHKPNFKYKKFRSDLIKHWSFKCGTCNKKVSSKSDEGYYIVDPFTHQYERDIERACSVSCGEVIWREKVNNWISRNDFQEFVFIDEKKNSIL